VTLARPRDRQPWQIACHAVRNNDPSLHVLGRNARPRLACPQLQHDTVDGRRCASATVDGARPSRAAIERSNRAQRYSGCNTLRDFLALIRAQRSLRSSSRRWPDPAMRLKMLEDRSRRPVEHSTDQLQPFTSLPTSQTSALSAALSIRRRLFPIASPHNPMVKCCVDPPETATQSCHWPSSPAACRVYRPAHERESRENFATRRPSAQSSKRRRRRLFLANAIAF